MQVDVEVGLDEALANPLPDNPCHFVAIDFDDGVFHLDLGHACFLGGDDGDPLGNAAPAINWVASVCGSAAESLQSHNVAS